MKPGDPLNVRILPESYELIGKENTAENKEMARWHDFIFLWKIKLCILWENTVRM